MAPIPPNLNLRDLPRVLWYRKRTFVAVVFLMTAASGAVAYLLPNVYEATSTLLLDQKPIAESYVGSISITPDIKQRLRIFKTLLMSEYLLRKVITKVQLIPNIYDPLAMEGKIEELRKGITVRIRETDSLQLSYEGTGPQMVMRITNELANFFIEDTLRHMQKVMEGTSAFLDEELVATEKELRQREEKIVAFKEQHLQQLPDQLAANQQTLERSASRLEAADRNIREVTWKYESAQRELAEFEASFRPESDPLQARLEQLEAKLETFKSRYTADHPDMTRLVLEIAEIRKGMAADSQGNQVVGASLEKRKIGQEEKVRNATYRLLKGRLQQYEQEARALKAEKENLLQKIRVYEARVDQASQREQELVLLTRGYDVLKERYRALMGKKLDAQLSVKLEELQRGEKFRVLDPATLPLIPIRPNRYLILAIGFVAALGLGLGAVIMAEMGDVSVRPTADLTPCLGLPLLACIPHLERLPGRRPAAALPGASAVAPGNHSSLPSRRAEKKRPSADEAAQSWSHARHIDPGIIMLFDPGSPAAEEYRYMRTNLKALTPQEGSKVLMVTSPWAQEGKTVTAVNLAVAMTLETDEEVLLIDGDMRTREMHRLLGLRFWWAGLAEVLSHEYPVERAVQPGPIERLMILSAGAASANPADLICRGGMAALLSELRRRFKYIILDSPPILPVADACLLAAWADAVILVVRAGVTRKDVLAAAVQRLGNGRAIGMVLNGIDQRLGSPYGGYAGYRGSGQKRAVGGTEDTTAWS